MLHATKPMAKSNWSTHATNRPTDQLTIIDDTNNKKRNRKKKHFEIKTHHMYVQKKKNWRRNDVPIQNEARLHTQHEIEPITKPFHVVAIGNRLDDFDIHICICFVSRLKNRFSPALSLSLTFVVNETQAHFNHHEKFAIKYWIIFRYVFVILLHYVSRCWFHINNTFFFLFRLIPSSLCFGFFFCSQYILTLLLSIRLDFLTTTTKRQWIWKKICKINSNYQAARKVYKITRDKRKRDAHWKEDRLTCTKRTR